MNTSDMGGKVCSQDCRKTELQHYEHILRLQGIRCEYVLGVGMKFSYTGIQVIYTKAFNGA